MHHRILALLAFFSLTTSLSACGYYLLGEEYRIALFNPYLIGEDYETFFYSSERFSHWGTVKSGRDRISNVELWAEELGGGVTGKDVNDILYGQDLNEWLVMKSAPNTGPFADNPAWRAINARPDVLEYALYAKGYEKESMEQFAYAKGKVSPAAAAYRSNFRERAKAGYDTAKNGSFLKERYAYQLLLLAYYRQDAETLKTYFDRHFKNKTGPLADWARFHYANLFPDDPGNYVAMANAFRYAPEKAFAAYQRTKPSFNPEDYLKHATSNAERSNLYALAAIHHPGYALELLDKAYRLDPANPVVKLLAVREMNKLEDWLMTYELTYLEATVPSENRTPYKKYDQDYDEWKTVADKVRRDNYARDRRHLKKFRRFLAGYRPTDPRLGQVIRGQAALLDEDYNDALAAVDNLPETDDAYGLQVATIRFLATVQQPDLPANERDQLVATTLPRLESIYEEYDPKRGAPARLASQVYEQAGDTVTAFLLHNRSLPLPTGYSWASEYYMQLDYLDRPISGETMRRIIRVVDGTTENPAQEMLVKQGEEYLPAVTDLHDLAGTLALRRNDLQTALRHFEALPVAETGAYLRYSPLSDIVGKKISFPGKANVVRQMMALEEMTSKGGDAAAAACLTLATAWYHMSDHGHAWRMLSYGTSLHKPDRALDWPYTDGQKSTPHTEADFNLIYQHDRAEDYLDCAESAVDDPELAARISFLRANIRRDIINAEYDLYYSWETRERDDSIRREKINIPLRAFRDQFRGTDYYAEVRSQCLTVGKLD